MRLHRDSSLDAVCARIAVANQVAGGDSSRKLGKKTAAAFEVLQKGAGAAELLAACTALETYTALSVECSRLIADAAAAAVLFKIIRSCNRTTSHQELLRY